MKKYLLCGIAAIALAACGEQQTASNTRDQQKSENTTVKNSSQATAPELGDWGVKLADMDTEADPGDDFYRYVNGKWLDTFEIPEEFSSYGSFTVLFERSEDRVKKIIEDAASSSAARGSNEQKIGDYYNAYLDVDAINAAGFSPAADDLATIASAQSHEDVARIMGTPGMVGNSPFGAFVNVDSKRTDQYIIFLTQAGLGMPNRNYYVDDGFADKRDPYRAYITQVLGFAGMDDAAAKAQAVYDLERQMAEVHWEPAKRRNRDLTYNLKTKAQLKAFAPEAPWDVLLEAAGLGDQEEFVIREDDAIATLAEIFADTPVETWKAYMTFHHLNTYSDVLPSELDDASFAFFGTAIRGTPKQRERWKRGVASINGAMGEAVGQMYVERHFPAASKEQMQGLVANLRTALDERLDTLPWMSDETKEQAHEKLAKFTPKIGYPDKWRDYTNLEVTGSDAFANSKQAAIYAWNWSISRLGGPVDKTEWGMTPQRVNAYYSPPRNEIVFPAAILQAPFFDPNADPAVNYGGIGAVIGHEIGHGFDDQGRKSDGDGVLRDWWTSEDASNFQELADALGGQYATYEPVDGFFVDPELTMGENIGDVGGLAMAYHAYKLSLNGEEAPVIDGFTGDQRFFMAWAQVWKRIVREEALKNQVKTDPHSPAQYRVNGVVRNMDAWYDAFNVTEGDDLYLPPEERVQIW
ncbi:M13 family metallopeptidase [Hyphococcus flavus]|uniref:M13 family metallopeptidase n=1 Tax=Hyphococcus flavus TaxID=1866326 RepID=A0AAF0CBL7_9PROT|nr:M13 family metallopeptidase [Hyphococcus flavus]WDI31285.1 M13 family metallopeptidase [Hyphococcus flavus]